MRLGDTVNRYAMILWNVVFWCITASIISACLVRSSLARDGIEGIWFDNTGQGAVQIMSCSEGDGMCGYIVWLQQGRSDDEHPLRDGLNEDPEKRARLICGLQVIGQLKPQSDGGWDLGWIYDPKRGRSFDVAVRRLQQDQLEVTGYLGVKFLSESFIWVRAPESLEPCYK